MKREPELYFISLIHLLGHLKEEVAEYYPNWKFNKGSNGFVTYRVEKEYTLEEIHDFSVTFSMVTGKFIERGTKSEIEALIESTKEKYQAHTVHRWDLVDESGEMGDRKTRGPVVEVIRTDSDSYEDEYVLGVRFQVRGDFAPFSGTTPIPEEKHAPSRAYYKLGEAFKRFRPLVGHEEVFLDIGCAPGGSTYYLLKKGYRVLGVDPVPVDRIVTEDFPEGFLPLSRSYDKLKAKHLKGLPPVNWIVFDVDTPSLEALENLLKLMSKLEECVGLIMTVKLEQNFNLSDVREMERLALSYGFSDIRKSILPSHDKEFCFLITKTE